MEGTPHVVRDSELSLWQTVQNDLRLRIERDEFPSGVPGEMALARDYNVSRSTIRAALAPLRRAGIISAHRGRMSTVVNVSDEQRYGPVYSLFAAVENTGMTQRSKVNTAELRTDGDVSARLGLSADTELVFIRRTRFADADVIAVDDVWLPAGVASPALEADLGHTALYQVLRDQCGITLNAGQETLHATTTNNEQSRLLDCDPGAAVFFIERLGTAGGKPVEWRETLIRGDRFTVTTSYPSTPVEDGPAKDGSAAADD
ncbi:GntR family transcriptional regulator [Arthrobacter castelli]|uniref:GntR family transcriptional regulator n=1 Tax=Arthrobacter castelli TaxID=271431 RepID=UPI0009D67488|nr:GntR family transcriptional regulator [Arthrobacter castelli]